MVKRIGRRLSNWGRRGVQARKLRRIRRLDQAAYGGEMPKYPVSTGISEYDRMFETGLHDPIRQAIEDGGYMIVRTILPRGVERVGNVTLMEIERPE